MNDYIKQAKKFLEAAEREFQEGKARNDPIKIRDAAEKAWNATVHATNGLFFEKGEPIPKSNRARREGLEKVAPELRREFESKAHSLHAECFYDGICPLHIIEEDIKNVGEYIRLIERK